MSSSRTMKTVSIALTGALLLGAMALRSGTTFSEAQVTAYHAEVRSALDSIPFRVGNWIGVDTPVPPAAQRLLRPNAILSRTYRDPEGRQATVMLVHCRDTRDMIGHYPPICYPAHGWRTEREPAPAELVDNATWYRFTRQSQGQQVDLLILNYLEAPGVGRVADMDTLRSLAEVRQTRGLGAAQIQILFESDAEPADQQAVVEEFERVLAPVVARIRELPT